MSDSKPTAVITGASSGIGAATARALAAAGYRVALLARRVDRITTLANELDADAIAIEADLTDRDALVAAAERVKTELGGANVLVNNAGVMLLGPFSAEQRSDFRKMIEVNLIGAITTTEVFLDQLKDGGDVVNIPRSPGAPFASATACTRPRNGAGTGGRSHCARSSSRMSGSLSSSPASWPTELSTHISHEETRHGVQAVYDIAQVTADDVAEVIAFALARPRHLAINEILLCPAGQA